MLFLLVILSEKPRRPARILLEATPYLIGCILYLVLRSAVGVENPRFSDEHYGFSFGANIFVNTGLLLVQSFIPVSSLSVAELVNAKAYFAIATIALFSLLTAAIVLYGMSKSPHRKLIAVLCILTMFSWVPVIFLGRVSEQYGYSSAPFVVALVALALQYYWSERRLMLKIVGPVLGVALIANIVGISDKASAMKEQGHRAEILFGQVVTYGKGAPPNGSVYLVHPEEDQFYFSLYRVRGFVALSWSEHLVQHKTGRPDLRLSIVDSADYAKLHAGTTHLALTYDPVTLQVYPL